MNISIIFIPKEHICVMLCADKLPMQASFDQDTSKECFNSGTNMQLHRHATDVKYFSPHTGTDLLIMMMDILEKHQNLLT